MRLNNLLPVMALLLPLWANAGGVPKNLEPLPEAPPPPGVVDGDPALEPEITITKRGEDKVEEYRIHGELYMMKITPPHGVPYYLMKEDQEGGWSRMEGPTPPLVVPKWILFNF